MTRNLTMRALWIVKPELFLLIEINHQHEKLDRHIKEGCRDEGLNKDESKLGRDTDCIPENSRVFSELKVSFFQIQKCTFFYH